MIKNSATLLAATAAISLLVMPAQADEITLKGASCFPIGSPPSKPFEAFVDDLNGTGKGVVQIKMIGGAPAIGSPFEMTKRMTKGIFDVVGCPEAYWANVVPEAASVRLSDYSAAEMRTNGGYAYLRKLYEAKNIHFLARHSNFGPFFLWLNKKIDKPDLTGLHLRVSPVYVPFFKSLGATVQRSNIAQIYTYMENGTVQGYGWPALGWVPSWIKVTKYRVEPGFYYAFIQTLVNKKTWAKLTTAQQDMLNKVGLKHELIASKWAERLAKQNAKTTQQGMKVIKFTGAEAAAWVMAAKDTAWASIIEKSPNHGPKLRQLLSK
jgi:TRAP-type C4-dicarboxylate transport system substrate-binding protein